MKPNETADFHIRWSWYNISRMYNTQANEFGGTMAIGYTLLNIDKDGTPSMKLGPKMGMEPTSLSRILNTMEERGYIARKPNPNDGRGVLIYLTEQGKEKRDFSKKTVLDFNNSILNHVDEIKMKHFFEVIDFIKAKVEKDELVNIK